MGDYDLTLRQFLGAVSGLWVSFFLVAFVFTGSAYALAALIVVWVGFMSIIRHGFDLGEISLATWHVAARINQMQSANRRLVSTA